MITLRKNIKYFALVLLFVAFLSSCDKDDDNQTTQVNYPSGINDLSKLLKQKIDFAAVTNPDSISYQYDANRLITSVSSTRNRYLVEYQYDSGNVLLSSRHTDLISNSMQSETHYTYSNIDALTVVTLEGGVVVDSTLWILSNSKALEATSYLKNGGRDIQVKKVFTWNGEDIEKYEKFERIDLETSFNNHEAFPESSELTIQNIATFYSLELSEQYPEYYLVQRIEYESYSEVINSLRYLSTVVPVTESQKIYMIHQTQDYDEERLEYFNNTGYTTFTADNEGYPIRLATGGAGARKFDFIYE